MAISVIFNIRKFLLSFILLPWFFMGATSFVAASEISLNIEHQVLENKKLQTFFGAYDEQSNLIEEFDVLDISVLYGDRYGDVRRLEKFESSRFGTAYTFMIDISKSMSIQNFNLIKASIAAWAEKLEEGDSVSLVSFGEEVLFLQDYTFYKDDFLLALDKVQRSDMETRFYDGLIQTYQFAAQNNSKVPYRRVIICLTDGLDEIEGGPTKEAVMEAIDTSGTPTFMIGFAEKMTPEKIFGINLMKSISKTSNGLFFDANRLGIDNAFEAAKQSIDNVFMLTSYCDKCNYDGSIIDFKLNIFIKDQALSASSNLLLPQTSIQSSSLQAQPAPNKTLLGISMKYLYIVAAVLLLFMLIIIMVRVFRKNNQFATLPTNLDFQATMPEMESDSQPPVDNSWAVAQNAMKDSSTKLNCQLVFLRSSTKHSITIGSDFIIGRSSKCALILKEHKEVSGTHCKLSFKDNLLTIEDLNSTNGTFVNGARITKAYPLSNLDSLSLGKAEFRINFKS